MISLSTVQTWALVAPICALILICTLGPLFRDADRSDNDDDLTIIVEEPADDDRLYDWAIDGL